MVGEVELLEAPIALPGDTVGAGTVTEVLDCTRTCEWQAVLWRPLATHGC